MFSPPDPHTQLQSVETIEPSYLFAIHPPSFPTQEHPDPQIPKSRPNMGQITNA